MDIISAYREVGTYRGAAALCGTTHKTVARVIQAQQAPPGRPPVVRAERAKNFDSVATLVAKRVASSGARVSAKRLLPVARAAGYAGSPRQLPSAGGGDEAGPVARRVITVAGGRRCGRRVSIW